MPRLRPPVFCQTWPRQRRLAGLCGIRWRCLVHRKHRCRHGMPDGFSEGGVRVAMQGLTDAPSVITVVTHSGKSLRPTPVKAGGTLPRLPCRLRHAGKERSCRRFRPPSPSRVTSLALLLHPKFSELLGWGAFFRIVAQLIEHLADEALFFLANAVARLVLSRLSGKGILVLPGVPVLVS